jgi:hypothetical protein
MILIGDFNVDFAKGTSKPLVDFLKTTLDLDTLNDPNESTTKYGTMIDAVFFRYLGNIQLKVFISYHYTFPGFPFILTFHILVTTNLLFHF